MRDDLHVGAPLPRRWKSVLRVMTGGVDWPQQAIPKAETALTSDLQSVVLPSFISDLKQVIDSGLQPSVFGRSGTAALLGGALVDYQSSRIFHPFESKCIDYLRRHSDRINNLNCDDFLRAAVTEVSTEHIESMRDAALAHIGRVARSEVPEARRRLSTISSTMNIQGISAQLVEGSLRMPRKVAIDIHNEDLSA